MVTLAPNGSKYTLIRDAIRVHYSTTDGECRDPWLWVIKFANPDNHESLAVREP